MSQNTVDGIQQFPLLDGFCQMERDSKLPAPVKAALPRSRAQPQDDELNRSGHLSGLLGDHEAVHPRHVTIEKNDLEWQTLVARRSDRFQGPRATLDGSHFHLPVRQYVVQDAAIGAIVVNDENAPSFPEES